jgi:hypothetical protein
VRAARLLTIALAVALVVMLGAARFRILFYLGFPGEALSLLITGGHGGTRTQEIIAPIVSFLLNAWVYFLLLSAALRLRRGRPANSRAAF